MFPHQRKGVIRAVKKKNYAFFFEPRLGKSKAALDTVGIHAIRGDVRRVLILSPKIAMEVWEDQIKQHFPLRYRAEDYDNKWVGLKGREFPDVHFFLAGREHTWHMARKHLRKELEKFDPDLIIVDESHEYKRAGGRGAQDLWRMVRRLRKRRQAQGDSRKKPQPWVIELSGTPNPKGFIDLFSQFRILDERIMGTNQGDWKNEFVITHPTVTWKIIAYRRAQYLDKVVRRHSYAVSADEAGLANEEFSQKLSVYLPERVKRMYLELATEFLTEWEGGVIDAANAGVKRLRLLQLVGGYTTDGSEIHRAKVEVLKGYLTLLLEQGESVVVYARFRPEVKAAFDTAEHVGFRTFRVDGTVKRSDRSVAIASLSKIPKTPTAVCFQHQAGSRAIELVGAAETVYYSTPDGWVDYFQTRKRTQGPNQKRPVRYTHLIAPGTVDVSTIVGLQEKEEWHQMMMRNPKRYLFGLDAV
jgi:hypothetical protein